MTENNDVVQEPTVENSEDNELLNLIDEKLKEQPLKDVPEDKDADEEDRATDEDEKGNKPDTEDKPEEDETKGDDPIDLPHEMDKDLKESLSKIKDPKLVKVHVDLYKKMLSTHLEKTREKAKEFREPIDFASNVNKKFEEHGVKVNDKVSYMEGMLNFNNMYTKNPINAINILMKQANVKIEDLDQSDEYLSEDGKKVNEALQKIDNLQTSFNHTRQEEREERVNKEIEDFKKAKNADDSLKYPYFEELSKDMVKLLGTFPNDTILELYDKASKLNPKVSQEIEDTKIKVKLQKEDEERKSKLKKAGKIQNQNLSSRPLNTKPANWMEAIRSDVDSFCDQNGIA